MQSISNFTHAVSVVFLPVKNYHDHAKYFEFYTCCVSCFFLPVKNYHDHAKYFEFYTCCVSCFFASENKLKLLLFSQGNTDDDDGPALKKLPWWIKEPETTERHPEISLCCFQR